MAMPIAMTATIAVPGLSGISSSPMVPNISTIGITAGTSEMTPPLKDVYIADMMRKITNNRITSDLTWAIIRLSAAWLTIRFSLTMDAFISLPTIAGMACLSSST